MVKKNGTHNFKKKNETFSAVLLSVWTWINITPKAAIILIKSIIEFRESCLGFDDRVWRVLFIELTILFM
ncbi:hypothetical protein GCM10028810_52750 [Spirosoma litoris]